MGSDRPESCCAPAVKPELCMFTEQCNAGAGACLSGGRNVTGMGTNHQCHGHVFPSAKSSLSAAVFGA